MIDKAILNGKIYQEGELVKTNLYIEDETIYAITKDYLPAKEEIDASGLYVFPGIIDPHVHFDLDLGYIRSADNFERGSMIAALGGVTTIIDFLEPVDNEIDLEKAYRKRVFEAEDSKIDYKFHACIKNPKCDLETFVLKMLALGMNTLKCFTTYSDTGRITYDEDIIRLLRLSDRYKFLLLVHAEDDKLIDLNPNYTFRDLNKSRPKEAEINKALQLAGFVSRFGGYLYMVHVSSGETVERLKETYDDLLNKRFFIESCPQYFMFDDSFLKTDQGYLYTFAPPLRSKMEKVYLRENIDWIYTIGTDHCPFKSDEKAFESLNEIPLGVGSIEHSFDVMYNLYKEKIVDKMTKNVAILHHLENQKGKLKVGLDADLFLYKPGTSKIVDDHSECDYSIYKGLEKSGQVISTMVRGNFVVKNRTFESGFGKLFERQWHLMKALINARIFDFDNYYENGYLIFSDKIIKVGKMEDFVSEEYDITDCGGELVMPSLIAGHTHIYSIFARGLDMKINPQNFQEILDQLWWKIDREIDNKITYASAIVSGIDHLKNGVTTLVDHHASGTEITGSLDALKRAIVDKLGMRGIFAFETSDRFDSSRAIEENMRFLEENHTQFVSGMFGMHASMSLSDETLSRIGISFKNAPIHIHVAESTMDEDDSISKHGMRIIERLDKFSLLTKDSLYVHGIHINDLEMDLIKKTGGFVSLNISSNMNNGVGLPDYQKLKSKGIPVIIGNDGLNPSIANEYQTLLYSSHLFNESLLGFSLQDLKQVIDDTYRFASNRLNVKLGRLRPGYAADLLILPYTPPTPMNITNALGHIFYGMFSAFKPSHVFVAGRMLVNNYQVSDYFHSEYENSLIEAKRLWLKLGIKEDN